MRSWSQRAPCLRQDMPVTCCCAVAIPDARAQPARTFRGLVRRRFDLRGDHLASARFTACPHRPFDGSPHVLRLR